MKIYKLVIGICLVIVPCFLFIAMQGCGSMSVTSLSGGGGDTPSSDTGTIEGRVRSTSGQPIVEATITIEGSANFSLSRIDGSYAISNAPVGTYAIYASREGFVTSRQQVTVSAGNASAQDFTLSPEQTGSAFSLISTSFASGSAIPKQFTIDGSNESVGLEWKNIPQGAKSFAVSMVDLDTLVNSYYKSHFLIINIASSETSLNEGAYISEEAKSSPIGGMVLPNNFTVPPNNGGYNGPGTGQTSGTNHTYQIRVYALNSANVDWRTYADFAKDDKLYVISVATIEGTYTKK